MSILQGRKVVELMCWSHGIPLELLVSGRKTKTISKCRAACALELRRLTELSGMEIAGLIGRKSSVATRDYPERRKKG